MNKARKLATAVIALFFVVSAVAVPDQLTTGEFDADDGRPYYREVILTVFREGYANDVRLRMLVTSTAGEWLVGVKAHRQSFQIFALRPKVSLWWYEHLQEMKDGRVEPNPSSPMTPQQRAAYIRDLEASLPRDYRDVPVEHCAQPIDQELARGLIATWERVLSQAHSSPSADEPVVLDGASFHFWVKGQKQVAGHVYAPDPEWPSKRLTAIGADMSQYCREPAAARAVGLRRLVDNLR